MEEQTITVIKEEGTSYINLINMKLFSGLLKDSSIHLTPNKINPNSLISEKLMKNEQTIKFTYKPLLIDVSNFILKQVYEYYDMINLKCNKIFHIGLKNISDSYNGGKLKPQNEILKYIINNLYKIKGIVNFTLILQNVRLVERNIQLHNLIYLQKNQYLTKILIRIDLPRAPENFNIWKSLSYLKNLDDLNITINRKKLITIGDYNLQVKRINFTFNYRADIIKFINSGIDFTEIKLTCYRFDKTSVKLLNNYLYQKKYYHLKSPSIHKVKILFGLINIDIKEDYFGKAISL